CASAHFAVAGSIRQRGQMHISNQKVGLHAGRIWLYARQGCAQDGSTLPAKRVKLSASISASTAAMSGAKKRS
ncbi:MAG: hypothetical protein RL334_1056, partial [Chloroflexota bacterium]